jgi:hypothetical protein
MPAAPLFGWVAGPLAYPDVTKTSPRLNLKQSLRSGALCAASDSHTQRQDKSLPRLKRRGRFWNIHWRP